MKQSNAFIDTATRAALVVAAGVSVGVHVALAPEHLREWAPLGAAFVAAVVAVAAATAAVTVRRSSPWPPRLLGGLLAGIAAAYVLTRLVALPPLDPMREAFDPLGLGTSAIELLGAAAALSLGRVSRGRLTPLVTTGGQA
jgi:hypothetical protein